jgi:hypothetical protein
MSGAIHTDRGATYDAFALSAAICGKVLYLSAPMRRRGARTNDAKPRLVFVIVTQ